MRMNASFPYTLFVSIVHNTIAGDVHLQIISLQKNYVFRPMKHARLQRSKKRCLNIFWHNLMFQPLDNLTQFELVCETWKIRACLKNKYCTNRFKTLGVPKWIELSGRFFRSIRLYPKRRSSNFICSLPHTVEYMVYNPQRWFTHWVRRRWKSSL